MPGTSPDQVTVSVSDTTAVVLSSVSLSVGQVSINVLGVLADQVPVPMSDVPVCLIFSSVSMSAGVLFTSVLEVLPVSCMFNIFKQQ